MVSDGSIKSHDPLNTEARLRAIESDLKIVFIRDREDRVSNLFNSSSTQEPTVDPQTASSSGLEFSIDFKRRR